MRKRIISEYYKEWVHSVYLDFLLDSINDKQLEPRVSEWMIDRMVKPCGTNIFRRIESIYTVVTKVQPKILVDTYICIVFSLKNLA